MRVISVAGLVLAMGVATACGKSDAQKQAEDAQKQSEQAQEQAQKQAQDAAKQAQQAGQEAVRQAGKAVDEAGKAAQEAGKDAAQDATKQAAQGLEALAKGLQGLAATGPDGKPVDPISFRDLQTVFVPLNGWEMGKPTGSRMTAPVSYSQAEVTYRKGDSHIKASIMDSGYNQLLIAPFSMFLTAGYEKETESGYEKSVKLAGNPGWEKWEGTSKSGELSAFVNKRFVVHFEGSRIDDTKVLYQLAQSSNLAKLASLK
jgi:hypothetical protein